MKFHDLRDDRESGQATVEFAVVVPALLLVVLAFVQVSLVVLTKFAVTHTAREVARVLVIDPGADPSALAQAARPFGAGALDVTVEWRTNGGRRTAIVRVADEVDGIRGFWIPNSEVATTVAMVGE
jgi:Flp pilus assembly protein TadG